MTTGDARLSEWMVERIASPSYDGGFGGTCYGCPFASAPLYSDGIEADWRDVSNDPTEAFFSCSLAGRNPAPSWGEDAPCTAAEWTAAAVHFAREEAQPAQA